MKDILRVSPEARMLIDKGFKGNGCGSGLVSKLLCWIATRFFDADLSEVWRIHDAEYSLSRTLKTRSKKKLADDNLWFNLSKKLHIPEFVEVNNYNKHKYKKLFVKLIHTILLFKGDEAYWDIKPNHTLRWVVVAVLITYLLVT